MNTDRESLTQVLQALVELRAEIVVTIMRRQDPHGESPPPSISAAQHLTLSALRDGPLSVGDIAERTGVSASTTTRMLQGLKRRDLIVDAIGPGSDRRRRYVALTETGRQVTDARSDQITARFAEIIDGLGDDDIETLLRGVRIFEGALKRRALERRSAGSQGSDTTGS